MKTTVIIRNIYKFYQVCQKLGFEFDIKNQSHSANQIEIEHEKPQDIERLSWILGYDLQPKISNKKENNSYITIQCSCGKVHVKKIPPSSKTILECNENIFVIEKTRKPDAFK